MSDLPPALQPELKAFMASRRVRGMVAGLVRDGKAESWGLGAAAVESGRPPDASTVFEIGSLTQVFTGTLLARMAKSGRLRLDQPIRDLLQGRVALPPPDGGLGAQPRSAVEDHAREVSLLHLATHTSTLPRASRRMLAAALRDRSNPYRDYTIEKLYADLAEFTPGEDLGRRVDDSDLGAGLLGHLLALAAGQPYEELLREQVCVPLGLRDTAITLDGEQRARLAQGYLFGKPVGLWDLPALPGGGALRSTAADLLLFVQASLDPQGAALDGVLRLTHAPLVRATPTLSIGIFWRRTPLGPGQPEEVVWHHGQTSAMRAFVGMVKKPALGLVLLANTAADLDELGLECLARVQRSARK